MKHAFILLLFATITTRVFSQKVEPITENAVQVPLSNSPQKTELLPSNSIFYQPENSGYTTNASPYKTKREPKKTILGTAFLYSAAGMLAGGLIGWAASPGGNTGDEQSSKGFGAFIGASVGGVVGFPVGLVVGIAHKSKKKPAI